ncbi:MAG: hypothetical protein WB679_07070 [Terracidiphilus sp.]
MTRSFVFILLLVLTTPAFAKPYPVPCSDLWSAVTDTLGNAGNYKIVATDEDSMRASFIVVGALYPGINALFLKPQVNGCELQIKMGFTGNDDESALRGRVNRALAKMKTAKQSTSAKPAGNL